MALPSAQAESPRSLHAWVANQLQWQFDQKAPVWGALILRVTLGVNLFFTARFWIRTEDRGASLVEQITPRLESTVGFYRPWLEGVVLENPDLFATMVTTGESFVAITMLLGLTTRAGAAVGMFLMANYALGWGNSFVPPVGNWMWCAQFVVVLFMAPGRVLGVDAWLHRRWPRVLLW